MSDDKKDSNRTTIIITVISTIGVVLAALITAYATITANSNHPTPAAPPSPTPLPDPAAFVRSYFNELWQTRDYDNMWNNDLTPKFKTTVVPKGENDFIQTWSSMQKIDVNSVTITSHQSDTSVSIKVNLTFYKKTGSTTEDLFFDLTYNPDLATWQFDVH